MTTTQNTTGRDTITFELTRAQRDAYLYDWAHHEDTDDADLRALFDAIYAPVKCITGEDGKRQYRVTVTLTAGQACDFLTYVEYAIDGNEEEIREGNDAARKRNAAHHTAYTVARNAGAETIREYQARTAAEKDAAVGNDAPANEAEPVVTVDPVTGPLDVRTADGRRFPVEVRLDLTGPHLEVFVPGADEDPDFALDREPTTFGVFEDEEGGRLYWTIPALDQAAATRLLQKIRPHAEQIVTNTKFEGEVVIYNDEADRAVDEIAQLCSQIG